MTTELLLNKCRGSLVGGAVGDALGYAVEFSSLNEIRKIYGQRGITDYKLNSSGVAEFSASSGGAAGRDTAQSTGLPPA